MLSFCHNSRCDGQTDGQTPLRSEGPRCILQRGKNLSWSPEMENQEWREITDGHETGEEGIGVDITSMISGVG